MNVLECSCLIVGGGIAGVSCAETLAFLAPEASIVLLAESSLIKAVTNLVQLGKCLQRFDVVERVATAAGGLNQAVKVVTDRLAFVDSEGRVVRTESGRQIRYKLLCLCTGARPRLIDASNPNVIGIRDTESAIEFQKRVKNARRLAIVGNGGIASEVVYEVKNVEVDWIIKDRHISSTFVDPGAAKFFQDSLMKKNSTVAEPIVKRMRYTEDTASAGKRGAALGPDWHRLLDISGSGARDLPDAVRLHFDAEVKEIRPAAGDYPLELLLTNGETIQTDFLVSATGVTPSIDYETDQPFTRGPDGGLLVTADMRTSLDAIYAAGDVCSAGWPPAQHWFQMRLWTQARQMGAMAGKSMAATLHGEAAELLQDFCFELFGHVTRLFGYQVVLLGRYNGQGLDNKYELLLRVTPDKEYIKFVLVDGRLQGAILIGDTGLEETCENLILNQIDLTPFGDDILDPNIDIEDYFD